ncbi:DUF2470 domain-containing protein [Microtetraspora sp. AC03309]|uniref:DUF2470 domain-containing protein n=1 Tax=Microtetraspora sp. AC03309 TaxID=2779376 RepID=UPI001E299534|nr:DUF2470 domain-containing protein [Microtetraspora sp. AC03309]MCC5581895.1 DUF2470 domain-containing protein [Microtetraspora sp. AC03309]
MHPVEAPPIAERIRTLAATAAPTHISVAGAPFSGAARGGVDAAGRPVLLIKPGEALYGAAEDEIVVTVDLVATRDTGEKERPRGLLKIQGWVQAVPDEEVRMAAVAIAERCPDSDLFAAVDAAEGHLRPSSSGGGPTPRLLRVDVAQVVYLTGQESGVLDAENYLDASPDPFLDAAERIVLHVNAWHRGQLALAIGHLLGEPAGSDVWLWELDRYGATVWSGPDRLIRLPWPSPATSAAELEHALSCVMCPRQS